MKKSVLISSALAMLLVFSCEKAGNHGEEPDNGNGGDVPQISYQNRQKRSGKRGVSFNFSQFPAEDCAALGSSASWSYNWGHSVPSGDLEQHLTKNDIEYVQMIWNGNYNADAIRTYKGLHPESEYILAFNEPNLTDQANMTPEQAAAFWPDIKNLANELGMKIISPAMNYGTLAGYHDPIKWLDEFFAQPGVSLEDVDGIAIHCYMNSPSGVQGFVKMFEKYGKPIWLTEFCAGTGSVSEATQMAYMSEMFNYLEQSDLVERYAWFMPRGSFNSRWNNALLTTVNPFTNTSIELTPLGVVYANMSTFDKSLYYAEGEIVPAEHYSAMSGKFSIAPATDPVGGLLQVYGLNQGGWAEYQVELATSGTYILEIRYSSFINVDVSLSCDGGDAMVVTLENSGDRWITKEIEVGLQEGKHVLKLSSQDGYSATYNYFRLRKK